MLFDCCIIIDFCIIGPICLQLYWPLLQTRWDERCAPAWASCVGLSRPLCTGLWVAEMMTMKNKVLPLVSQGLISTATLLFLSLIFVIVTWPAPASLIVTLCGFVMIVATHSSFCGSMNVKGLVAEDAAHLKLNGSLCKQTHANPTLFPYTQLFPALAVNGWVICVRTWDYLSVLFFLIFFFKPFWFFAELFLFIMLITVNLHILWFCASFCLWFDCSSSHRHIHAGDDCKGKQHAETHTSLLSQSSRLHHLAGALWNVLVSAG